MTTIGSMPYAANTRYVGIDSQESARRTSATSVADTVGSPLNHEDQPGILLSDGGIDGDDTDTFLYTQTGELADSSAAPTGPAGRFTSIQEENLFLRTASKEELTEVYGARSAESKIRAREALPQAIAALEQMVANATRDNPELVANMDKSRALESISGIEDNLKLLNMYRETRDDPTALSSSRALAATWMARFLGNVQNYSEAMRSVVDVAGDLVMQQDDGTYVLSNFTLSYKGVHFFEHKA